MPGSLTVRFRVDFGSECSVGVGKIELLEGIARTGSLSQAARQMRMSYRRAWLLLEDLNMSFDQPVANTSVGGRGGGGAVLTPFGVRLVAGFRKLDSSLRPLADRCLRDLGKQVVATRTKKAVHAALPRRKLTAG
jgi:molybdate transport system regulatory protein